MIQTTLLPPRVIGRAVPMSFEEFLQWAPDEGQAEWVDGEGTIYASNSPRHVRFLDFFAYVLRSFTLATNFGEVSTSSLLVRLPTRPSGRMPDIVVVRTDRLGQVRDRWLDGPVDLVVEFVSDDSFERDTEEKLREYEAAGIIEYLYLDARDGREEVGFLRLGADGRYRAIAPDDAGRYHSEALPGFWFHPRWLYGAVQPDPHRCLLEMIPDAYRHYLEQLLAGERS